MPSSTRSPARLRRPGSIPLTPFASPNAAKPCVTRWRSRAKATPFSSRARAPSSRSSSVSRTILGTSGRSRANCCAKGRAYNPQRPAQLEVPVNESEVQRLASFDLDHIIHPQFHRADHENAIIYTGGKGALLFDVNGNEYIDGLSSLWNVAVGHGRAELGEAAAAQMSKLGFSNSYTGYANLPSIELAEKLLSLVYPNMS